MMRSLTLALAMVLGACATHRDAPALYDFDSVPDPPAPYSALDATIAVREVDAPSWLRTPAIVYRLGYETPSRPQPYAHSQWSAPPAELVTLRLRELLGHANSGLTLKRLAGDPRGYQLEVTLEQFEQTFSSSSESRCLVTLNATLLGPGGRALGQSLFHAEKPASTANASGAVGGLVQATDDDIRQLITWLGQVTQVRASSSDTHDR